MPTNGSSRRFVIVDDSTIREAKDRKQDNRPRKRQRVDSDDEDAKAKDASTFTYSFQNVDKPMSLVRDPVYYSDDSSATCIIRVGGSLFKIHHELLSCCPFMVEELHNHRGLTSDKNPLRFVVPTEEEFRAFLWALYATTEALAEAPTEHAHLERLFHIAFMTEKYDIPLLEEWVTSAIHSAATDTIFMDSCSSATLAHFIDTATRLRYDYTKTLAVVAKKWCDRLLNKSTPSVPAIQAADKHDLLELRGVAYYVHVQDMLDRQTTVMDKGATQLCADPKLSKGQVLRLLSGHWSLVSLWERLRLKPILLPMGSTCTADVHSRCRATWERRWTSAAGWKRILGLSSADVLALLDCLRDQLSGDEDLKAGINSDCRLAGLEALKGLKEKTKEGLADHFFECL
ncbi:hypothetical protein B0H34DRAFT_655886 [Crassisporium funariophilum]|nr:hypothetical protein B0H34DRAFT_655886 [Crassisporium funariophilum]